MGLVGTAWKVSKYGVFSRPYFPVFGLNTEIYCVNLSHIYWRNLQWKTFFMRDWEVLQTCNLIRYKPQCESLRIYKHLRWRWILDKVIDSLHIHRKWPLGVKTVKLKLNPEQGNFNSFFIKGKRILFNTCWLTYCRFHCTVSCGFGHIYWRNP